MILLSIVLTLINLLILLGLIWALVTGRLHIKAKSLSILDDHKTERLRLDPKSTDVRVFGKSFQRRQPASGLIIFNKNGDETGGFGVLDDGTISLTLDSYQGDKVSERASIYVLPSGETGILLKDIDNKIHFKVSVDENGNRENQ